jgi:DNA mismatch repair protein MutL
MTSRIKLLPEGLINLIAAGEVVERPASVLKELLENSLDAGATKIEADIESGGKKLIRVADNGCGLTREELFLCLERHATSKLTAESDLFAIGTLGFRGEALPSIASVSRMTVISRTEDGDGHRLKVDGGRAADLSPAPANQGTIVEVKDLFFNVPARRKFLKTEATETAHLLEAAQRYALSRPGLRLRLRDSGRELLSVDEHNDLTARVSKILGREVASSLRTIKSEDGDLKISGLLAGPEAAKAGSSLFAFVLGRPVRDKLITKAVVQGYGRTLPQGRLPSGVVFIDLDPAQVDVNVHPAKTEVRFRDPGRVFEAIRQVTAAAVGRSDISPASGAFALSPAPTDSRAAGAEMTVSYRSLSPPDLPGPSSGPLRASQGEDAPGWTIPRFSMGIPKMGQALTFAPPPPTVPPWMKGSDEETPAEARALDPDGALAALEDPGPGPDRAPAAEGPHQPARALAQLHRSYILAQGPEALHIIDQHAAHERVLFNSLKAKLSHNGLPSQGLLLPETLELGPHERLAAERLAAPLRRLGFRLEPFGAGPGAWALRGIPSLLSPKSAGEALQEILASAKRRLRDLDGAGLDRVAEDLSEAWLHSLACRAAVKAGDRLTAEEMDRLVKDLAEADAGGHCPHGRPSVITLSLSELEKRFGRS